MAALGLPHKRVGLKVTDAPRDRIYPCWEIPLDSGADVVLTVIYRKFLRFSLDIDEALILAQAKNSVDWAVLGVFAAWAASRGLLEEKGFPGSLLGKLKAKEIDVADFARQTLHRGLWDSHLSKQGALRQVAYLYFHKLDEKNAGWINKDFAKPSASEKDSRSSMTFRGTPSKPCR